MINPGKTILSKGSFPSRSNCSAHHFSANCSISCILNVRCLMSVSMTAQMTTSQNRRSDSQTAAVWIMFTCWQAAGIILLGLPRHRTSGVLPVKSHVGLYKIFSRIFLFTTVGIKHQAGQSPKSSSNFLWEQHWSEGLCCWVSHKSQLAGTRPRASLAHLAPPALLPTHSSVPEAHSPGIRGSSWECCSALDIPSWGAWGLLSSPPNTQLTWHKESSWQSMVPTPRPTEPKIIPSILPRSLGEGQLPRKLSWILMESSMWWNEILPCGCPFHSSMGWKHSLPQNHVLKVKLLQLICCVAIIFPSKF